MVNALSLCSLLILSLSVNAATHAHGRRAHGHARADAVVRSNGLAVDVLDKRAPPIAKRAKRCKPRSSLAPTSTVAPGNVGGDPEPITSVKPTTVETPATTSKPHSTKDVPTTSIVKPHAIHTPVTTSTIHTTPTHTKAAAPTTSAKSGGLNSLFVGTKAGQGTFYATGLNACGGTNNDSEFIAAASFILFDSFPGHTANPNDNPICNRKVIASRGGKSVTVAIVDRCAGCMDEWNLDFSPAAFNELADPNLGRVEITWVWA